MLYIIAQHTLYLILISYFTIPSTPTSKPPALFQKLSIQTAYKFLSFANELNYNIARMKQASWKRSIHMGKHKNLVHWSMWLSNYCYNERVNEGNASSCFSQDFFPVPRSNSRWIKIFDLVWNSQLVHHIGAILYQDRKRTSNLTPA